MLVFQQKSSRSNSTSRQQYIEIVEDLNKYTNEDAKVYIRPDYEDGTSVYIDCEDEAQARRICSDLQSCTSIHFDAESTKEYNSDFAKELAEYEENKNRPTSDYRHYALKPTFTLIYDHVRRTNSQRKRILEQIRVKESKIQELNIDVINLKRQLAEANNYDLSKGETNV